MVQTEISVDNRLSAFKTRSSAEFRCLVHRVLPRGLCAVREAAPGIPARIPVDLGGGVRLVETLLNSESQ